MLLRRLIGKPVMISTSSTTTVISTPLRVPVTAHLPFCCSDPAGTCDLEVVDGGAPSASGCNGVEEGGPRGGGGGGDPGGDPPSTDGGGGPKVAPQPPKPVYVDLTHTEPASAIPEDANQSADLFGRHPTSYHAFSNGRCVPTLGPPISPVNGLTHVSLLSRASNRGI